MKLLLVRHGESVGNQEGRMQGQFDSPLSDKGREQARALAQRLVREKHGISSVYASDLVRASETAVILAASLGLPVILDPRLREYDIGIFNGVIWREVEYSHPEIWREFHTSTEWVQVPEAETNDAFHARLMSVITGIQNRHEDGETVAVVSHGGSIGMILAGLLGLGYERPTPFRLDNTSLTIVEFGNRGPYLSLMNDTHHLDGDRLRRKP
jgi:broad specificity phosphatase PhoE